MDGVVEYGAIPPSRAEVALLLGGGVGLVLVGLGLIWRSPPPWLRRPLGAFLVLAGAFFLVDLLLMPASYTVSVRTIRAGDPRPPVTMRAESVGPTPTPAAPLYADTPTPVP